MEKIDDQGIIPAVICNGKKREERGVILKSYMMKDNMTKSYVHTYTITIMVRTKYKYQVPGTCLYNLLVVFYTGTGCGAWYLEAMSCLEMKVTLHL